MNYTLYNDQTGQIISNISVSHPELLSVNVGNDKFIEGTYSDQLYYIDNNQQPILKGLKPSEHHEFDYISKSWQFNVEKQKTKLRRQRNELFRSIDRINPVWFASLTTEQQQELVVYRQQLLDVPQQSEFPDTVEWPAKPTWL